MRMKPFFTGLLSRIFSRQAATAQRPKRFAKIVAHTFCSTASANTFQSVAFDILFGAAGFQIQIHKPYALTMLNLKGFFLSNSTTFPGFHSPLASKARPAAHERPTCYARVLRNGCTCCQIRLNPPGATALNPNQSFLVWLQAHDRMSFQPVKKCPMPLFQGCMAPFGGACVLGFSRVSAHAAKPD